MVYADVAMDRRLSGNIDRILTFVGIAISSCLFVVPRTPTSVACVLFVLFVVLLHPVVTIAAACHLRAWLGVVLLLGGIVFFGHQIWHFDSSPSAREIAREVAANLRAVPAQQTSIGTPSISATRQTIPVPASGSKSLPPKTGFTSDRPLWNLTADTPLIRVSTTAGGPGCASCWSPETRIEPGQTLYVNARYANFGKTVARGAWLKLAVPRDLKDGTAILATLGGNNSDSFYGAACLIPARGPVTLIPDGAEWYPYGADHAVPLPFNQSISTTLLSRNQIELGDVSPGKPFTSDIVFRFRTLPITLAAVRDVETWSKRSGLTAPDPAGMDLLTAVQIFMQSPLVNGELDATEDMVPRGWVSPLERVRQGEAILVYVHGTNPTSVALHNASLHFIQEGTGRNQALRVNLTSTEITYTIARTRLTFAGSARDFGVVGALRIPNLNITTPVQFANTRITAADLEKWVIQGDSPSAMPLGDLSADCTFTVVVAVEVQ